MPPRSAPGAFTVSFDLELAWGEFYRGAVGIDRLVEARRRLPDLLRLLERHDVRATFAVVGHLLLEGCDGHPSHPRPSLAWRDEDWFAADPRTDERRDPAWYGASLVRAIRAASPGHDVGAHGFAHVPLDDPGTSAEVAREEVGACARLLGGERSGGLSFVFPRNGIRYLEVLKAQGFASYRAVERRWWNGAPRTIRRAGHMLDQALALAPPVGDPGRVEGLVEVPSGMLFLSREGFRRRIPMASRVARARRGLARAVAWGRTFHLWMHVEDLVPDADLMLGGLDVVLGEAAALRDRGLLAVRTMADHASERAQ